MPDLVKGALEATLENLKLEYLDLFMIHWPIVFRDDVHRPEKPEDFISLEEMPLIDTWRALENCVDAGLCRNIGVCNFSVKKLKSLLPECRIKPSANQVECHPFLPQTELFEFCQGEGIQLVAYSPLGSGDRPERMRGATDPNLFEQAVILDIAKRRQISTGQVMLAWAVTRGSTAIPKSSNPGRMAENLAIGSIELTSEEMAAIDSIEILHRYVHGRFWEMPGAPYTIANLWDE